MGVFNHLKIVFLINSRKNSRGFLVGNHVILVVDQFLGFCVFEPTDGLSDGVAENILTGTRAREGVITVQEVGIGREGGFRRVHDILVAG